MSDVSSTSSPQGNPNGKSGGGGILDFIEWVGNKLPDPATLFLLGAIIVMILSHLGTTFQWSVTQKLPVQVMQPKLDAMGAPILDEQTGEPVQEPLTDAETGEPVIEWREVKQTRSEIVTSIVKNADGEPVIDERTGLPLTEVVIDETTGQPLTKVVLLDEPVTFQARSLLTRDGLFWAISSMVDNFMAFPPLGVVLVGMLGIGVAERTGLIGAILKGFMLFVPHWLLTPAMVFVGIMSSMTLDAGYVVLPPLAAALYKAVGRSPLAGLAAVFAGVSAGFNANLFITGLEPMLAGFANTGAQVIDPDYVVNPACNWYFMIASTAVMTLTGWAVTSWFVEHRLTRKSPEEGGPVPPTQEDLEHQNLTAQEVHGLWMAGISFVVTLALFLLAITIKNAPLNGIGANFDRWVEAIVPMLFFCFVIPGIVYGISMGNLKNDKDIAKLLMESMSYMAPIIVLAFFAAQFIEYFRYSGLDRMLAIAGGQALGQAEMSPMLLIVTFIGVTMVFNLFVGSMSAKYAMFAPIFIPMFMMIGISPELTQAAYRIGDSVTNIITPLNAYLVIILVFMQKYVPKGGMGTLISTMVPYTIVFAIVWTIMLMVWMWLGWDLGPDGGLFYDVQAAAANAANGGG